MMTLAQAQLSIGKNVNVRTIDNGWQQGRLIAVFVLGGNYVAEVQPHVCKRMVITGLEAVGLSGPGEERVFTGLCPGA